MAIATARMSASLARPAHCPLCGTHHTTNELALRGLRISTNKRRAWIAGTEITLTAREFELLLYLAERVDEVVTKQQLYRDIRGYRVMPRSTRTAESHLSRLRRRIYAVDGNTLMIDAVWGTGWRLRERAG